jgi:lantibiotic modifying enzyme
VRSAIASIVASTEDGFDPRIGLWPLHPADRESDSDHPMRSVYLGAAGIIWALDQLSGDASVELVRDYGSLVERLEPEMVVEPDEAADWPADGFLGGRCGALAVAQRHRDDAGRADLLLRLMAGGIEQPALDLFYGAPGMMVLAAAEHARTGDKRFADLWRASAQHVLAEWREDDELGVRLWTQVLRAGGRADRYVGFGHGFAGNSFALLRGDLLDPDERRVVELDAVATAKQLAIVEGDRANWPPLVDEPLESSAGIRTQWCHGAPGVINALAHACPDDDAWSDLLLAAGHLTWDAGPLRDRASLCHGTAGNAYAFLALWQRTSDELWLERARLFAMHALDQVERDPLPWHSLFTGDLGVALCLRSCLNADARFPTLDWF